MFDMSLTTETQRKTRARKTFIRKIAEKFHMGNL